VKVAEPRVIETAEDYETVIEFITASLFAEHRTDDETRLLKTWFILVHDYEQQARLFWP
jgi:hypothetical protein